MLVKDKGIILRQVKYNDKANIVTIFTGKSGKKSFILYGIGSKRKGSFLRNIVQPLYLVDLEYMVKQTSDLGRIKNIALDYPYKTVPVEFDKKAVLLFLSEVLNKVLHEHLEDRELFDFVYHSLVFFDMQQKDFSNFHIAFLIRLTRFVGIEPFGNYSEKNKYFDIRKGHFSDSFDSVYCLDEHLSKIFSRLLQTPISDSDKIVLTRDERQQLLQSIVNYYSYHIDSFGQINSLDVLSEIYGV